GEPGRGHPDSLEGQHEAQRRAEPVSVNVRQPSATTNAASPSSEIAWPVQSSRKSRLWNACRTRAREGAAALASIGRTLSSPRDRPPSRGLREDDQPRRQGGEPRARGAARRAGGGDRRRRGRAAGEVERDRGGRGAAHRRRAAPGGGGARRGEPLEGGESVAAMAEWARTHGITLGGGSISEKREGREKLSNTSPASGPGGERA